MAEWQGRSGVALCHPSLTSAGKAILTKAIRRAGWSTDQFTICQPHDIPAGTRAIVALGDPAQEALTGWFGGKRSVKYTRGYLLQGFSGLPVVPTFDPTQLAQGQMKLLGLLMNDIGVALQAAVGARKVCLDPKTVTNYRVGLDALRELYAEAVADPNLLVAFDLETATSWGEDEDESIEFSRDVEDGEFDGSVTSDSDNSGCDDESTNSPNLSRNALDIAKAGIRTVQFSLRPGTGVSCDWSDECRDWVQRIMQLPNPQAGHNCFYYQTKVLMANWKWKDINRIKVGEYVKSVDVSGQVCNRIVTAVSHTKDLRDWVEVKVDGGYKRGSGRWGNPGVVCTPDHKWILEGGQKTEAKDLLPGDLIRVPGLGNEHIIFGSLLGDGSISQSQKGRFVCGHSNKEWAEAKANSFGASIKPVEIKTGYKPGSVIYTFSGQVGHFWRDWMYREDGSRIWLPPSLEALAIWYGDDGCLAKQQNATFSLHKYPDQIANIKAWFEKIYGPCSIHNDAVLYLHKETSEKFFRDIEEFLHPSMSYKLPFEFQGNYNGWMEEKVPQLGMVESVTPVNKIGKWAKHKYCMTVDETHTFFTRMGLVSNSWLFDEPILRNHGVEVREGTHDTLWLSHHLQPDLPKHLQGVASWINFPFPWKHMSGADLDFYGSVDVDSVQWIMRDLPPKLKRLGLWEGYERYVRQFRPVLAAMEKRGIPVSKSKLEELRTWLGQEITRMDSELQPMIPAELKGRKIWKSWPADTKPLVEEYKQSEIAQIKSVLEAEGKKVTKKALALVVKPGDLPEPHRSIISEELGYEWDGDQLYKTLDFNPRSSDQILQFIRAKGYPVPKRFKDQKDTTSDKELAKLEVKTKDPALGLVRSIRAYSKMSNAYAGKQLPDGTVEGGWQPGPDGFLRATFTFGPATWQLSARNPNVMTTPKRRKELAVKFRQCIEAPPGYKLVSFDFKSFHALTTALEARDPLLMRLSRLDVHSFLAGHLVKYPGIETCTDMSDTDLAEYLEEIKSKHKNVREFQAKPCVHGTNFGQSARRMYFEYADHFENQAAANRLLDLYKALFPRLFKYQEDVCEEADRNGRLTTKWGAIRWFFDVKRWVWRDGKWISALGRDAEKVKAFKPSNDAHGMFRDKVLQAYERGWTEKYGLCNLIHDDTLWMCPDNLVEECIANVKPLLESPVPQLADPVMCPDGFVCGVDGSVGTNWADMKGIK